MARPVAVLLLIICTMLWGFAFIAQKSAMDSMGPLSFASVRYLLGGLVILPLALWEYRRRQTAGFRLTQRHWLLVGALSIVFFLGSWLQQAGLEYTRGPFYPSLAYRLAQIATGKLDATVVRRGSQDWDLAGAAAILGECGIGFEDACGAPMRFNRADVRHGALAAFAQLSLRDVLCGALDKVYGCPEPQLDLERKTT